MKYKNIRKSFIQTLAALVLWPLSALAIDWPQEITAEEGTIVVYQPQPDKLEGNLLSARAAMSLELKDREDAIFGAFWFEARIDTDTDAGTAVLSNVKVTRVRWPESKDAAEQRFTTIIEGAIPETGFEISLERLSASLKTAEIARQSLEDLKNDPPQIVFSQQIAVLLIYDGAPRYTDVGDSDYERIVNSPFAVARRKRSDDYYLSSGKFWYHANDPMGPWSPTSSPPADLVKMVPAPQADDQQPDQPPAIVAADKPTELIVTQGAPDWQALEGGALLYVQNTESPWLRELSTGNMYLLLSGRWFRSKSQDGPWTFVRPDELPASFQDIPPASDIGGVRTAVAGTDEAQDAMLDAHIPQTAAIKRSEAKLTVEYDGEPKFEDIPGTIVAYAVNTGAQVLKINDAYYAVDNGVWFTSQAATGPWVVADSIPENEIQKIPPSSPVYNTTHVHIYESTPEIVYVGYTPGYMWSFPYYGVPVYGTGWYYPPYVGHYYYPRPPTWGFHVGYNPWTGWNFGMSWSNGFFTFGIAWGGGYGGAYRPWGCCGGWYGGGYRGPVFINNGDINIGNNVNFGDRDRVNHRLNEGASINPNIERGNVYNRAENLQRNADRGTAQNQLREARPAANRANNVFADQNGNVARVSDNQWQSLQNGQWTPDGSIRDNSASQARDRMQTTPSQRNYDRSSLNNAYNARQHGASRQMSRPTQMRRPSGGRRR